MNALPLSYFILSRTPYRFMKLSRFLMSSTALVYLHIRITGQLLYRSIPISMYGSPVTCLLCNLAKKSLCISGPDSVNTGRLIFSVIDNSYFLPELMEAVHVLHFSSMFLESRHTRKHYPRLWELAPFDYFVRQNFNSSTCKSTKLLWIRVFRSTMLFCRPHRPICSFRCSQTLIPIQLPPFHLFFFGDLIFIYLSFSFFESNPIFF